jgi:hypothetical protein
MQVYSFIHAHDAGIKIKLLDIGVGSLFYYIIKQIYDISKSCVKIQNQISDFFPLNVGVKQGDNLTPSLFKIFVNDLPSYLSNTSDPVNVNGKNVHCLMYADNIILLSKLNMPKVYKKNLIYLIR